MRLHALAVLGVLVATGTARAEDYVLADGTRWVVSGRTFQRGSIKATGSIYNVDIGCVAGFGTKPRASASYLAPGFIATEEPDGKGGTSSTVCLDGSNGVLVFNISWSGSLAAADHDAIRGLLADLAGPFAQAPGQRSAVALFAPAVATVTLTAATGRWESVADYTNTTDAVVLLQWPLEPAILKLNRSTKPQRCSSVGFPGSRPSWAPTSFAPLGYVRDGQELACLDQRDGTLLLVTAMTNISATTRARIRALLEEIAKQLGPTTSAPSSSGSGSSTSTTAPSNGSPFVSSADYVPPARSTDPAAPASSSSSSYTPSPYAYDSARPSRSLGSYLRGFSFGVHRLAAEMETIDDGYGGSIGYAGSGRARGFHPLYSVALGYDRKSKLLADAQLALGTRSGDRDLGGGIYAAIGFDGVGLGEEPAPDRVYIPGELYYGGLATLRLGALNLGLGYYARNSDEVGSEWRFELGYRLDSGRRIVGRYVSYADTGSFLSLALAL